MVKIYRVQRLMIAAAVIMNKTRRIAAEQGRT